MSNKLKKEDERRQKWFSTRLGLMGASALYASIISDTLNPFVKGFIADLILNIGLYLIVALIAIFLLSKPGSSWLSKQLKNKEKVRDFTDICCFSAVLVFIAEHIVLYIADITGTILSLFIVFLAFLFPTIFAVVEMKKKEWKYYTD